jgi:transcription elongation factor GreA
MTGPGDAVDHAVSISRQVEVEHIQGQINQLQLLLSLPAREDSDLPEGVIGVGSTVRLAFPGGDEQTMLLATIEEAEDAGDVLTYDSPLGKAKLGKQAGDEVDYAAPAGSMKVKVVDVDNASAA